MGAAAGALAAVVAATSMHAQASTSTLPPTQPTIAGTTVTGEQPANKPHHAAVTYINGQIDVRANDSSLNQIQRSISRRTGLKITGGVEDQRVFGNYGPAPISSVLATLLDGTGTNILLLEGDAENPPKLMLTPRSGGPTPPSPDSSAYSAYNDSADEDATVAQPVQGNTNQPARPQTPVTSGPQSIAQPLNDVNGSPSNTSPTASTFPTTNSVPLDSVPTPSTTPATSGIVDAPNPPPAGSTTGTAPNGTLTPEQVMQELLKMQQKQQQQPTNSTPASTPPQP